MYGILHQLQNSVKMMSTMADTVEIQSLLQNIGLSDDEGLAYMALLESPTLTVLQLSRKLGIPRTTTYRHIDTLLEKGFVEKIIEKNGTAYKAIRPNELGKIIQSIENQYKEKLDSFKKLKQVVPQDDSTSLPPTQVRYYKGKKGIKQIMWNTLKAKDIIYGQSQYRLMDIIGNQFLKDYSNEFIKRGLKDRTLITELAAPTLIDKLRTTSHHQQKQDWVDIHIMNSKDLYISGDTWIYNNTTATALWNKSEIIGVEIENEEITKMQLSLFKIAWKNAVPFTQYLKKNKIKI